MSVSAMQTVIAKLCVDHKFRQTFASNPDRALESFALTARESEEIKSVDMQAVREYASSLLSKRLGLIKKWFPLSFLVLAKEVAAEKVHAILNRYGLENIRGTDEIGGDWVRAEFHRVSKYLHQLIAIKEIEVPHFTDVLEFEVLKFSMLNDLEVSKFAMEFTKADRTKSTFTSEWQRGSRPLLGKHARLRLFKYNMAELIPLVEEQKAIPPLEVEPTWVLFFKRPRALGVDTSIINLPLKRLIELCDGGRTIDGIISSIASHLGITDAEARDDCLATLEQLYIGGAVDFIGES
jgi:hypothetical protein